MQQALEQNPAMAQSPAVDKAAAIREQGLHERSREPRPSEPQRIDLERIVVVPKLSKFECDMQRFGLGEADLIIKYEAEHAPVERILSSHYAQRQALDTLRRVFSPRQFCPRDDLSAEKVEGADLVIAHGGDNHFQFISHAITDGFILGVNSDPLRSEGALVSHSSEELLAVLNALARGDYRIEEWTRLEGSVNGVPLPRVISEYFLGERDRLEMSRYNLRFKGFEEEQKGSGIIISTGSGSTGWYDSEISDYIRGVDVFMRTQPVAKLFVTAPYRGRLTQPTRRQQIVRPGDELVVGSLNDSEGIVGCDAIERVPFPRGALARIRISDYPLKVVKPLI